MSFSLLAAAALQTAAATSPSISCSLVTPRAEAIDLVVVTRGGETVLVPEQGSIWPLGAVRGSRDRGSSERIAIGGRGGLILEVGKVEAGRASATALLSRAAGRGGSYPVAVGHCGPNSGPVPVVAPLLGVTDSVANIPAFDPARWPEECGMLLADGRRVRFDYTIAGRNGPVRLESPVLWGNKPVTVRWGETRFGARTGPAGAERMAGHENIRVKIIHFSRIGDPAVSARTGLGICGYNNVVRRPNTQ